MERDVHGGTLDPDSAIQYELGAHERDTPGSRTK
jgi:hypothetical protein